ncbi:MAG: hypothetical protein K6G55_05740 [Selenomonadaceae bacterium]|nr:hypothetical protein [Selenomonadaceae bacterium]
MKAKALILAMAVMFLSSQASAATFENIKSVDSPTFVMMDEGCNENEEEEYEENGNEEEEEEEEPDEENYDEED